MHRFFSFSIGVVIFFLAPSVFAQSEAVLGSPFGVGCVVLKISSEEAAQGMGIDGITIFELNNRIFYPVVEQKGVSSMVTDILQKSRRPIGRLVGDLLQQESASVAIYFLFDGKPEPLNLYVTTAGGNQLMVAPKNAPLRFNALLGEWWSRYNDDEQRKSNDYPPILSEYLLTMLSYRLNLPRPETKPSLLENLVYEETGFQIDPSSKLFDAHKSRFFDSSQLALPADQPLPVSLGDLIQQQNGITAIVPVSLTQEPQLTEEKNDEAKPTLWSNITRQFSAAIAPYGKNDSMKEPEVEGIESMAFHVPANCFYIRFGTFTNFLWFQDISKLWGGDLRNLIALRAFKSQGNTRFETELAVKQDALAKLFGSSVIEDVAVIGTDLYFDEGGSFGLLFKAKNNQLLANDFKQKRRDAMKNDRTIKEEILDVGGQKVSFLSTQDQHVRSFYVAVGNYHLVSRSEKIIRDFIALNTRSHDTQNGKQLPIDSLGELAEFQQVRQIMSPDRNDTVFLYFSRPYFYNLSSAPYWIESRRRNLAASGIELLKLASLAAAGEGLSSDDVEPSQWVDSMCRFGFIPHDFGPLPDGSRTVFRHWSEIHDSVRGGRGLFIPISDHLATTVTTAEVAAYQQMCREFFTDWGNLDPLVIAFRHTPKGSPEGKMEEITVDVRMAPLSKKNSETLRAKLGEPMNQKLGPVHGNIASFEVALSDKFFFGGMQNAIPSPISGEKPKLLERITSAALLQGEMLPRDLVSGYMGLIGPPGTLLQLMDIGFRGRDDAAGYSKSIAGGWRRHFGQFTLYSQQRELLDQVSTQLVFQQTEMPAQFRMNIKDLTNAKITPILNNLGFARTRNTCKGNVLLLNQLHTQCHVSGPECKKVTEELLQSEMICPLGGTFEFRSFAQGSRQGYWTNTILEQTRDDGLFATKAPVGFVSPPLNWFRGAKLDAVVAPDAMSIHAELQMLLP